MRKITDSIFSIIFILMIVLIAAHSFGAVGDYSVALLKGDANDKTALIADKLKAFLEKDRFSTDFVSYQTICDKDGLNKYNCLILTDSTKFPARGKENLLKFLRRGSDMVLLGGLAFKEDISGQLSTEINSSINVTSRKNLFDFEDGNFDKWKRGAKNKANPTKLLPDKGIDGNCVKMEIKNIAEYEWDNFRCLIPSEIPANHNAFVLYAKATPQTKYLIFEIVEKDGSRWIYPIAVSPDWKEYVVSLDDLKYFGSDPNGFKKDDKLNLADANKISLGLAYGVMPYTSGDHTFWIDKIETGVLSSQKEDKKDLKTFSLPVFENRDIYYFNNAVGITTYEQQDILKSKIKLNGDYKGISAIAFEYPEVSRYIPLLEVQDKYSRNVGFAGGMLVNYAGEFKNSQWLLFGIESKDFYCSKEFLDTTIELLNRFKQKDIPAKFADEDAANKKKYLPVVSPAPKDYIKLSEDKKHFILPNGKKFFALGCNYIGSFERQTECGELYYNEKRLEEDFQKAKDAGINAFRFWEFRIDQFPERFKTIIELARKYGIYLILQPRDHPLPTDKELADVFKRTFDISHGQTIVLGYDLMNEPYITTIGSVNIDGKQSAILQNKTYEKYSDSYFDKKWVDDTIQSPSGWPEVGNWIKGNDAKNLYAAFSMFKRYVEKYNPPNDYSCLYGFKGTLPVQADYKEFISDVDNTFRDWILFHKKLINQYDRNHFITVGYNTSLSALPANELLDFTAHHIYQKPYSYDDMQKSVTTFDRLREFWPNKPITIGEFGFSSGIEMPDGSFLDMYSASTAEVMVYLYAFAHDYSGAYLWMLSEWPIANMKYNVWWIPPDKQMYESRFGMYYYDGTPRGKEKPIAYATKFFREYIDTHQPGDGKLEILQADTPIKTGYLFKDKDALFVGNNKYDSPRLKFKSPLTANVMLMWDSNKLKIMATCDVEVTVEMKEFGFAETNFNARGDYASFNNDKGTINIMLLKGQPVTIFVKKEKDEINKI